MGPSVPSPSSSSARSLIGREATTASHTTPNTTSSRPPTSRARVQSLPMMPSARTVSGTLNRPQSTSSRPGPARSLGGGEACRPNLPAPLDRVRTPTLRAAGPFSSDVVGSASMTSPTFTPPAPEHPAQPARPRLRRWLLRGFVTCALLLCGLASLLAIGTATGPVGFVVGLALAALPVFVVVAAFLWLDRYEAEPTSLLLFAFGWGAAVATLVALVLNSASVVALQNAGGDVDLASVVVAPVVEESVKGLGVLAVFLARRREFDGVVDGIVYAGMVGIGFAFVENVLYLGRAFGETGGEGVATVFVLRGVFAPFAHSMFTMAIGVGLGIAANRKSGGAVVLAPLAGWVVAVVVHGAWNLSAVSGLQGFVAGYLFLQLPFFAVAVALAVMARRPRRTAAAGTGS